jgi:hypothetical protein
MESRRNLIARLLAGLQVGMLGGLGILAWLIILSYWNFRAPWALMNLFAASLQNTVYWGRNFSFFTFTGVAAHLFTCGVLGLFIGWVLPRPRAESRVSVAGLMFGIIISLIAYEVFWRRYVPGLREQVAPASLLVAHLIFGMSLARFPRYYLPLAPVEEIPEEVSEEIVDEVPPQPDEHAGQ